jgi:nicotinate phosphoribosyltransferase
MTLIPSSLALLTDFYEVTMAYGFWKSGKAKDEAVFTLSFRTLPFAGGYAVACGLAPVVAFLQSFNLGADDIAYLAGLRGRTGTPLFERGFLDELGGLRLDLDVDAVPEGTVVFPNEPLLRVRGPLLQAQLVETMLLTQINFNTLIATKAARVCQAARGDRVIEFGLRRAQGPDGGMSASRASYVGGCEGTSNTLAGKRYGIPVRGTHAHSWVMAFENEREAFEAYARALPGDCIFLVDTYNTLEGIRAAIETGLRLRQAGHELLGIRLDSGDLAYLSIEARRMLDEAGLAQAAIVASNDLDEFRIHSLKEQGAAIDVWGVGTHLVTGGGEAALNGTYKLTAIRGPGQPWRRVLKVTNQLIKVTTPGILQARRYESGGEFLGDCIYDTDLGLGAEPMIIDPLDSTRRKHFPQDATGTDLLVPIMRGGRLVAPMPPLDQIRERVRHQLAGLHVGIKRLDNPHEYPVGLAPSLYRLKTDLILRARGESGGSLPSEKGES